MSAQNQGSLLQNMRNMSEVKVFILDTVISMLILEHGIMFKCSVQSQYLWLSDNQESLTLNMNVLEVNVLMPAQRLQRLGLFLCLFED
jgi:hypothetical protein